MSCGEGCVLICYNILYICFNCCHATCTTQSPMHSPRPPRSTPFPYTTLFRPTGARHGAPQHRRRLDHADDNVRQHPRSEEHTSELQSRGHLVCSLLLEEQSVTIRYSYEIIMATRTDSTSYNHVIALVQYIWCD